MAFPNTPRAAKFDLFVNGGYIDITNDVYARDTVTITRGRQDEQTRAEPQRVSMTINNRSGNYSPRNPMGAHYGSLGRNTPLRISIEEAADTFTRTVANGWGTSDTGNTYSLTGSGGTVQNSDFSVSSNRGRLSVPVTNGIRTVMVDNLVLQDIEVSGFTTLAFNNLIGAAIYPVFVRLRQYSTTDYVYAFVRIEVTEAITVGIAHSSGLVIAADTTVAGTGSYTSAVGIRWRAQAEGQTWRIKAWTGDVAEPYDWSATGNFAGSPAAGAFGLSTWVLTGNANTLPVVSQIDDLSVRVPRFSGEVSSWPQRWDLSGNDVYTPIEASGVKRRLGQGAAPLRSALYRHHVQLATPPVAYWPGEDPVNSPPEISPAIGPYPMRPDGLLDLAKYSDVLSSAPLFQVGAGLYVTPAGSTTNIPNGSFTDGGVLSYPIGATTIRTLVFIPKDTIDETSFSPFAASILFVSCTGTCSVFNVSYLAGGFIGVQVGSGTPFYDSGAIAYKDVRGAPQLLQLQLTESGGNTTWDLTQIIVGQNTALHFGTTLSGKTVGNVYDVAVDGSRLLVGCAFGHVSVRREIASFGDITQPLTGYSGEPAGARIQRLCSEEDVALSYRGDLTATTAVGPQGANAVTSGVSSNDSLKVPSSGQTLLDLLSECEDADLGILYEPRGAFGLEYRTRSDLYTQTPVLALDYSSGHLAPPLEPIDDDQKTRNNIITTRVNGQSAEAELVTGRLSTLDPSVGGVGRYNAQYTLNVASDDQLADLAEFILIVGTPDEARYPTISVELANPTIQSAGLEAAILAVNIGDRITIANPKAGVTPDTISQIVQGYTETIEPFSHVITFNCVPETPYHVAQFDSVDDFRFDTDTSTLVSGVSSSATTLSVANVNQPWTTDPTQMPIPIAIAGERMNVTAVSGTGTPQTFTVTRSVNGVVKALSAGAAVQIYQPASPAIGY